MEWMIMPLKRYADFSGRSRRKEYWMFFLFQFIVQFFSLTLFIILAVTAPDTGGSDGGFGARGGLMIFLFFAWLIFALAMFIPNMAVVVRRLHDQDIPGIVGIILYLLTVVLTFPGIIILIFMCLEGKKGDNQYGKDPRMNENAADVFR